MKQVTRNDNVKVLMIRDVISCSHFARIDRNYQEAKCNEECLIFIRQTGVHVIGTASISQIKKRCVSYDAHGQNKTFSTQWTHLRLRNITLLCRSHAILRHSVCVL